MTKNDKKSVLCAWKGSEGLKKEHIFAKKAQNKFPSTLSNSQAHKSFLSQNCTFYFLMNALYL